MIIHIIIIVFVICVVLYALYKQDEHDTYKELFDNIPNIKNYCNKDLSIPRSQQAQQFTKTNSCVNNWDNTYSVGKKNIYFHSQQNVYVPSPSNSGSGASTYQNIHEYLRTFFDTDLCSENKPTIKGTVKTTLQPLITDINSKQNKQSFYNDIKKEYTKTFEPLHDNFQQFMDIVVRDNININMEELIDDPDLFFEDVAYLVDPDL